MFEKGILVFIIGTLCIAPNCNHGTESNPTIDSIKKPSEGEKYFTAEPITVQWSGEAQEIELFLSFDDGNTFNSVVYTAVSNNTGTFKADNYSNTCKIKVQSVSDQSDFAISNSFAVKPLLIKDPIGGESFTQGQLMTITWKADPLYVGTIDLSISDKGGMSWEQLNENGSVDINIHSNYTWTIDDKNGTLTYPSDKCRIKIMDYNVGTINDVSMDFTIQ